jgi:hypothetical protein
MLRGASGHCESYCHSVRSFDEVEWQRAHVRLVVERGYSRDRDLESDLEKLRRA